MYADYDDEVYLTNAVLEMFEEDRDFFENARHEMADVTINVTGHGKYLCHVLEQQILLGDFGASAQHVINEYKEFLAEECEWARVAMLEISLNKKQQEY